MLTGQEGKLFKPLAFTKSFTMIGGNCCYFSYSGFNDNVDAVNSVPEEKILLQDFYSHLRAGDSLGSSSTKKLQSL